MKKTQFHWAAMLAAHLLFLLPCQGKVIQNQPVMSTDSLHYIQLPSGIRLAYSDEGAGATTLIFLHGLGSNQKAWQKNIPAFSAKYRCIAPDLPGYGASQQGDYAYDMTFFAKTVSELADALHLNNVVLIGHSMGSQIAIHCVLRAPQRWQKLILLAPAGFETFTEQERAWFQLIYTPEVLKATPPEQIRKNFEINFLHFPADAEFMIADRMTLRASENYDSYCRMIPKCVQGMLREPVFERLQEIRCPTLIVYGENDLLIPNKILHKSLTTTQVAESGRAQIPDCRLKMLPQAGHFVQWESANAANTEILNFLQ